jgi:hypothetical protein
VGSAFFYRFEFESTTDETTTHMMVNCGYCVEQEMAPVEVVGDLVISSFVKNLRLEQQQGKQKHTVLAEELMKVQETNETSWDSHFWHYGVMQRDKGPESLDLPRNGGRES